MKRIQSQHYIVTPHIPIYRPNKNINRSPSNNDYTNKRIFLARIERLDCVSFVPLVFAVIQVTALKVFFCLFVFTL